MAVFFCVFGSFGLSPARAQRAGGAPLEPIFAHAQGTPPAVTVVVAGGAARGFAYLGVLEAVISAGVPVDSIIGTSAGAMVAGLYCAGYSFATIREMVGALKTDELIRLNLPPTSGLLDPSAFETVYRELVGNISLEASEPRLAMMATELRPAQAAPLTRGNLTDAMRASISIPIVFPPAEFEGRMYIDGGLRDPEPVELARKLGADVVIQIRSTAGRPNRPQSLGDVLSLMIGALTDPMEPPQPDAALRVRVDDTLYFDFERAGMLIDRGRETAETMLPQLIANLRQRGVVLRSPGDPHVANPINAEWRARLSRGLERAKARPKPFTLMPDLNLGPRRYDPMHDGFGTRVDMVASLSRVTIGAEIEGGWLGPVALAGGLVETLDAPGMSGFARVGLSLGSFGFHAAFDPAHRPGPTPWTVGLTYKTNLAGIDWRTGFELDSLAAGLRSSLHFALASLQSELRAGVRFGYNGSLRAEGALALAWPIFETPLSLRLRTAGGFSTAGAEGFALGHPAMLRAYPAEFKVVPSYIIYNAELAYRFDLPSILGLASGGLELRAFTDGAFSAGDALWDLGAGVFLGTRLAGFLPFELGLDLAVAPREALWRVNLSSRFILP